MQQEKFLKAMQKDLETYKVNSSSAKQLFVSMKEISDWLKTQSK